MSKHTPGPWTLITRDRWPFTMSIVDKEMNGILDTARIVLSTEAQTVDDLRRAVGFPNDEKEKVQDQIAEQEANLCLMAAAPKLLKELKELLAVADFISETVPGAGWRMAQYNARAAILEAEGG